MLIETGRYKKIETGRYKKKTHRVQSKCKLCNCLEDESHFFLNCDVNKNNIRETFLKCFKTAHYNLTKKDKQRKDLQNIIQKTKDSTIRNPTKNRK